MSSKIGFISIQALAFLVHFKGTLNSPKVMSCAHFGKPKRASLGSEYTVKALGSTVGSVTECLNFLVC